MWLSECRVVEGYGAAEDSLLPPTPPSPMLLDQDVKEEGGMTLYHSFSLGKGNNVFTNWHLNTYLQTHDIILLPTTSHKQSCVVLYNRRGQVVASMNQWTDIVHSNYLRSRLKKPCTLTHTKHTFSFLLIFPIAFTLYLILLYSLCVILPLAFST